MKFRKKPIVIEATNNENPHEVIRWACMFDDNIQWRVEDRKIIIPTLEGEVTADHGDWIIRGIKGEYYPCKPAIFIELYEPVEHA